MLPLPSFYEQMKCHFPAFLLRILLHLSMSHVMRHMAAFIDMHASLFSGFEVNNVAIAHKYHTIRQLLIFLTVICGRFEDMDLPCRMHQSCTSHDSPPAPSDKSVSCSFVLLPVQMFTAFFLLFFFCLSCYISYVCLPPTLYICLSQLLLSLLLHFFCLAPFPQSFLLHFFCPSSSIIFSLSCSISSVCLPPFSSVCLASFPQSFLLYFFCPSSFIIFLSLLLYIFCVSCSICFDCLASFPFVSHSRLTRLIFSLSPPLSPICFSKFLSVSFTFNLSQSLPISFSVCLTRFLSISRTLRPFFSRSIYLSVSSNFMSSSYNFCLSVTIYGIIF
jgi:hypothetical protein